MKSPTQGAATSIHVAAAADPAHVTGRYFANSKAKRSSSASHDRNTAARLWEVSTDLVSLSG